MSELPFIDAHSIEVDAPAQAVWEAAERVMEIGGANSLARVLGCVDPAGFHLARDERPMSMVLAGEHRFARYELRFILEPSGRLRAETRAAFPGVKGAAYRALVIGSRGHVLAMRWLLARIKQRARGSPSTQALHSA